MTEREGKPKGKREEDENKGGKKRKGRERN